jgi:nanoRNase/pAp phosphatase (c-di-AMP/oligoRNAs hydrolase)
MSRLAMGAETPKTRLEALRSVLAEAAPDGRPGRFLVLTHTSPDPDALGALVGVRQLLTVGFGHEVQLATIGRIHRAENLAMVRELELEFDDYSELDPTQFDGSFLVDTQPGFGHTVVPPGTPLLAVFDHHHVPESRREEVRRLEVPHLDVREDTGATSSIVYEYLREAGVGLDDHTATALFCGVRYDTADLSQNASPLDEEAWYETFRRSDRVRVAHIARPRLPAIYYRELRRSLRLARRHGTLVLCLLGQVVNPESVAEMADFFLRMAHCRWSLVGGAYEGVYYVSLRTEPGSEDAYPLLERVLDGEGSFGGHGRVAGARIQLVGSTEVAVTELEARLAERAIELVEDDPADTVRDSVSETVRGRRRGHPLT